LLNEVFYSGRSYQTRQIGEFETALAQYKEATAHVMNIVEAEVKAPAKVDWQVVINHNNGFGECLLAELLCLPVGTLWSEVL
jgi:hypothetical protein